MTKSLALMHVGKVHFNHCTGKGVKRVEECHRSVSIGGRVNDDCRGTILTRGMNRVDQHSFMIALQRLDVPAVECSLFVEGVIDVFESLISVDLGFTGSQQVEIGAM